MNDRALGLLGIARRASALSLGHDAALSSVKEGRASVCILASDSSDSRTNLSPFAKRPAAKLRH